MRKFLLAVLLLSALPAMAEDVFFSEGDIKYQYFDGVTSYIGGYMTYEDGHWVTVKEDDPFCVVAANPDFSGDLVIPETVSYNGQTIKVRGIASEAFKGNLGITSVSFPATFPEKSVNYRTPEKSGIDLFGTNVFDGCANLTKVTFPDGMKAFYGGWGSACTFRDCPIAEAVIPESLTEFRNFLEESAVKTIDIPEWVSVISFENCRQLTEVPALLGMTAVPQYCFSNCESLTNVVVPVNATSIAGGAFNWCSNMETLVISDKVEVVGINAICHCKNLKNVTIGKGTKKLGTACFLGCTAIEKVRFKPTTPPGLENTGDPTTTEATAKFFPEEVYENAEVYVPKGSMDAYKAKPWFKFVNVSNTTGINDISVDDVDAPVEYFNMQGVRVASDAIVPGWYIRRQGREVAKIRIR